MTVSMKKAMLVATVSLGLVAASFAAQARTHHHWHKAAPVAQAQRPAAPQHPVPLRQGVVGYFGPGAYAPGYGPFGPFTPGYGYGYGPPQGDLGFALLGALNGGGFRGFVECGNYYARYPGACGI